MTKTEVRLLLAYLYNHELYLADEYNAYLQQLRYRSIGLNDFVECIILKVQLEQFQQVSKDLRLLLSLKKYSEKYEEDI